MFKHRRTMFGQYNVETETAGWFCPATLSIDFPDNMQQLFSHPSKYTHFFHECFHYWQGISTTYGFYYTEVASSLVHRVNDLLRSLHDMDKDISIKCPIYVWEQIEENEQIKKELGFFISIFELTFGHLFYLEGGLCNNDQFERIYQRNEEKVLGAWNLMLASMDRGMRLPSYADFKKDRNLVFRSGDNAPIVQLNDGYRYALGAHALAEGFALACQFLWNIQQFGNDKEVHQSVNAMLNQLHYTIAQKLIVELLNEIPNIEHTAWLYLPLLADIALMGPLLPDLRKLCATVKGKEDEDNTPLNWEDVQPGYRFLKALNALKHGKIITQEPRLAQDIVKDICQFNQWPTPSETAKEIIEKLTKKSTIDPKVLKLAESIEDDDTYFGSWDLFDIRLELLRKACKLRLEEPDIVSVPNSKNATDVLLKELPPILIRTHKPKAGVLKGAIEEKYTFAAGWWEVSYSIATGLIRDPLLLQRSINTEEGLKSPNDAFGIDPSNIVYL